MAEKYFTDMNNDVQITGTHHKQKSVDGYNRLPSVFTKEDVAKCFGYDKDDSISKKIRRLTQNHSIMQMEDGKYKKLVAMMT